MTQKAIVTAGTRGLGFAVARELSQRDYEVTIIGRHAERGKEAAGEIGARFVQADLSVLAEVRALGRRLADEGPWQLLVNNVGGMWSARWETADGIEASFAVNHLSPLLLTEALLDALRAGGPSRIVDVTSSSIQAALLVGTPTYREIEEPGEYYGMAVSGRAKLAHLAYNRELAERLRGSGVAVLAADPGPAATPNAAEMTPEILPPALRPQWEQIREACRRPVAEAARSIVFAATEPLESGLVIGPDCTPSTELTAALTRELIAAARALTERVLG
ncbi:SDR family NAD(P)-dependent oxidoreductase [Amycolatopsis viridis]|uniref:NAD(P)-dependent dehydrogenase (Short-subunit alcohol dehydrogenase family) n=1 Tax=Amycolatopsis viridis TaxID=185678 RepID=A0ABX0SMF8_9PSEU|nr:SDR family NAD(P)-dependent oxidoreductase [Amycolatopsis viridis]NIH78168.1 NAD(P)-dependent dehydrogenase (short-subunit alcohol dehydrogenase family) [Amycolatopsis viridis]